MAGEASNHRRFDFVSRSGIMVSMLHLQDTIMHVLLRCLGVPPPKERLHRQRAAGGCGWTRHVGESRVPLRNSSHL